MTLQEKYTNVQEHYKRIEREITVSEQGYLEILHGLNLAKLNYKTVKCLRI
jgi:hypothetical protein